MAKILNRSSDLFALETSSRGFLMVIAQQSAQSLATLHSSLVVDARSERQDNPAKQQNVRRRMGVRPGELVGLETHQHTHQKPALARESRPKMPIPSAEIVTERQCVVELAVLSRIAREAGGQHKNPHSGGERGQQ